MDLSMTTDYVTTSGCPEPYLRRIAEAGFSHVHWCHQWSTDFLYSTHEIDQVLRWLDEFGLRLVDLHASHGVEKAWASSREYERLAGVELVKNRIEMAARLGTDVIILHMWRKPEPGDDMKAQRMQLRRSLDDLERHANDHAVRIALENMPFDDFEDLRMLFSEYSPDYLGLCYDSGHGNMGGEGLAHLVTLGDRLLSVHLHDNEGTSDQHGLLYSGTVDWKRLAWIMAQSAYEKCVSMESNMRGMAMEEQAFLQEAFRTGLIFSRMVEEQRRVASQ